MFWPENTFGSLVQTAQVRHLVSKFRTSTSIQSGSFFFPLFIPVFLFGKSKNELLFCTVVIEQANSCAYRCSPCGLFIFIVMFSIFIRHMCSNSSKYMEVRLFDSPSNRMNCIYILNIAMIPKNSSPSSSPKELKRKSLCRKLRFHVHGQGSIFISFVQ